MHSSYQTLSLLVPSNQNHAREWRNTMLTWLFFLCFCVIHPVLIVQLNDTRQKLISRPLHFQSLFLQLTPQRDWLLTVVITQVWSLFWLTWPTAQVFPVVAGQHDCCLASALVALQWSRFTKRLNQRRAQCLTGGATVDLNISHSRLIDVSEPAVGKLHLGYVVLL